MNDAEKHLFLITIYTSFILILRQHQHVCNSAGSPVLITVPRKESGIKDVD